MYHLLWLRPLTHKQELPFIKSLSLKVRYDWPVKWVVYNCTPR